MTEHAAYLLAVSLVLGLGAFAVAAELYARFLARRRGRVLDVYAAVLALAVLAGVLARGADVLGTPSVTWLLLALPVGLLVGEVARRLDRRIVRRLARRRPRGAQVSPSLADAGRRSRPTPTAGAMLLGGSAVREPGAHRGRPDPRQVDPRQFPLATVVVVAVAEEAFYRGVLLHSALAPGSWVVVPLVGAAVAAFALTHLTFGWAHVLAKTPLGVGATALALAAGSVLPAVVAHGWFNVRVWQELAPGRSAR